MNIAHQPLQAEVSERGSALRAAIQRQLNLWGAAGLADDMALIATELVSNALLHGKPPVRVRLGSRCATDGGMSLRLEVSDTGTGLDIARIRAHWSHPSFSLAEGGRGLYLVDALCAAWGNVRGSHTHTVWAEVRTQSRADE